MFQLPVIFESPSGGIIDYIGINVFKIISYLIIIFLIAYLIKKRNADKLYYKYFISGLTFNLSAKA